MLNFRIAQMFRPANRHIVAEALKDVSASNKASLPDDKGDRSMFKSVFVTRVPGSNRQVVTTRLTIAPAVMSGGGL